MSALLSDLTDARQRWLELHARPAARLGGYTLYRVDASDAESGAPSAAPRSPRPSR